jgi:hypothetical protein
LPVLVKATLMWVVLLVVMVGNGILRVSVLEPRLGESAARQVASLLGIVVILAMAGLFVRQLGHPRRGQLLEIGVLWLFFTLGFEFLFGRYVSGLSWEALLADYDLTRGRLWPLVLTTILIAPLFWGAVHDLRRRDRGGPGWGRSRTSA